MIFSFDVSIPNRDFDELQWNQGYLDMYEEQVSIPNRDFDELQSLASESAAVFGFQGTVARMKKS